jgi:ubiquinone/menaquinone biosynthesis C-methylase UbiE
LRACAPEQLFCPGVARQPSGERKSMPPLFWSGKLSIPMRLLVDANNLLSLFTGSYKDLAGMKKRVRQGYEGELSDHVRHYDERGYHLQDRSARIQLEDLSFERMQVLDVGCGTGALARVAFENGARGVVCGDISAFMLRGARRNDGAAHAEYRFCQLDAGGLPFKTGSYDTVISGMTFGTLPDQKRVVEEMIRVARPGGLICVGAHGPEHYWEAIDATLWCINKRYVLGYRFEWWPRTESELRGLLESAGLEGVHSKREVWRNTFADGWAAYDFFAAISASWWYARFPPEEIAKDSTRTRDYFKRKNINIVTDDIVIASGRKPLDA